ncbi:MAG: cobalamin B12-binding domain-containing protein [Chloroflexi bacterium]|nr:cobalamin B12-binding domain-containing protein [Chloroflexota bacterium]
MADKRRVKVLLAKAGLDGHDRGVKVLALGLRDEGFEVIYTGLRQTPEKIAHAAIQEDADVVGMSCLSGAHGYIFPKVVELMRENGAENVLIIGGGVIPEEDVPVLKDQGIREVFLPGTPIRTIAEYIRDNVRPGE